jgi:hypothetical protein
VSYSARKHASAGFRGLLEGSLKLESDLHGTYNQTPAGGALLVSDLEGKEAFV